MNDNHPAHVALARHLLEQIGGTRAMGPRAGEVPSSRYTCPERFALEQRAIFRRVPLLVGLERDLDAPGSCLTVDVGGVGLVVSRGPDGALHAFRNACRHRGTELLPMAPAPSFSDRADTSTPAKPKRAGVEASSACTRKALVCPYHGWTYDLAGRLIHVPHAASFDGREASRMALVHAHVQARHGLVWAALEPFDLDAWLGSIDGDLASAGTSALVPYRCRSALVSGNWKLIVDAFLDGYHIRQLHRSSIYRFFLDACAEAEAVGDHIRALTARRALAEVQVEALERAPLRSLATPSYLLFPNVVVILHPDYVSVMVLAPLAADRTRFSHTMLIPRAPASDAEEEHWAKSFELIDDGVFHREDLAVVEAMQRGLSTGANETVLFGRAEHAALSFHESVERLVTAPAG